MIQLDWNSAKFFWMRLQVTLKAYNYRFINILADLLFVIFKEESRNEDLLKILHESLA